MIFFGAKQLWGTGGTETSRPGPSCYKEAFLLLFPKETRGYGFVNEYLYLSLCGACLVILRQL